MASHAGLVYTLQTKQGYIAENSTYTDNINKALRIGFERFGWTEAANVLQKLGFPREEVKYVTLEPSYDSRIGAIEDYLFLLGHKYPNYCEEAELIFRHSDSYDYQNYLKCIEELRRQVNNIYDKKETIDIIVVDGKEMELKEFEGASPITNTESETKQLYGNMQPITKFIFKLKNFPVNKYFKLDENEKDYYNLYNNQIKDYIINKMGQKWILDIKLSNEELIVYSYVIADIFSYKMLDTIRSYYEERETHITRMFGSYILLEKENNILKATKATPIPIKYCPLMIKLLKEVGGKTAEKLLQTLNVDNEQLQTNMMCNLINEVVIKGGYFDTNRPLNSCEVNVLFGASETISSAFDANLIDAAVIVSNNLGTIITTNASNTQGAVKRMTGLFYTSPSAKLMKTAKEANIIPVFPYTAAIDQIAGVKKAIELGYKNIAVTLAANDNILQEELKKLELLHNVTIYKFGLCSTGIDNKTALAMQENADIVWSCASKQIRDNIEPHAIAQVGIKIPVHIITSNGWHLVKNHLLHMDNNIDIEKIILARGDDKPVALNDNGNIKILRKKELNKCSDCPHPCV